MSRDLDPRRLPMIITMIVGLFLSVIPLPYWLNVARPDFLAIVVLYWAIMNPRVGGLTLAFVTGLVLDVLKGILLGEHALALCLATAIAIKLQLRIRVFPIWHQAATIFMLLVVYQFVLFYIDGQTEHAVTAAARWLPAVSGAALWPVFAGLLGWAYQRT